MLFGLEDELLTAPSSPEGPAGRSDPATRFLRTMAGTAASLPGQQGFFNAWGRVYLDYGGHIEIATIECDDPFELVRALEANHRLAARALSRMRAPTLFLANNNHSGFLSPRAPTFGTHENYLVNRSPRQLSAAMLPFLATRFFQGAGGVVYPSAEFVLSTRALFLQTDSGGDTTECRALYSTSRQEDLMGRSTGAHRLHLICADGHRSQYNWALLVGATALCLQAVQWDEGVAPHGVRRGRETWVNLMRRLNVLARPDRPPELDPLVTRIQRTYLDHVRRWMDTRDDLPPWAEAVVTAWGEVLDAADRMDRAWLAGRLDAFAKYELVSRCLTARGQSWNDLPQDEELFQRLTLLDHSYHAICDPGSVFLQLEESGLVRHRILEPRADEDDAGGALPDVGTRARARARFIRDHAGERDLLIDWAWVQDSRRSRRRYLADPWAEDYDEWISLRSADPPLQPPTEALRRLSEMRRLQGSREAGPGGDPPPPYRRPPIDLEYPF